ncbi:MAG: hypothetical protein HA490_00895 [Archaeoglobales archaeon]|nr:hypothetical protein [Archaeoglobales archaeon]
MSEVEKDTMKLEIKMFRDPWLDNAIENIYTILREIEGCETELSENSLILTIRDYQKFTKELSKAVIDRRMNLIVEDKDEKTGEKKEIKKDHVLIQEEKKIGGKVSLKEEIYDPERTHEVVSKIFKQNNGDNLCILCGRQFNKSVKKLQQASYPLVTKIASLSGVRSYKNGKSLSLKEYYENLCPICYFLGILEWTDDAVIYRTFLGEKSLIFMPQFENLKKLHSFKKSCRDSEILHTMGRYSNIRLKPNSSEVESTPGEYSTLLCFYEKFVEIATDEIPVKEWSVIHVPFGAVKNIKVETISISEDILGTIKRLKETEKLERIYADLIRKLDFYSEKKKEREWEVTKEIRESLSRYFLTDDFRNFTNTLLPRKGGFVIFSSQVGENLEELILEWRWRKMGVEKERLDAIKSFGNILAKVSEENASLLYKMDRARSIEEFWSVLREVARKLLGLEDNDLKKIKPTAIDDVIYLVKQIVEKDREGWKEVRDLIVVYASMYHSLNRLSKIQKEGGEEK